MRSSIRRSWVSNLSPWSSSTPSQSVCLECTREPCLALIHCYRLLRDMSKNRTLPLERSYATDSVLSFALSVLWYSLPLRGTQAPIIAHVVCMLTSGRLFSNEGIIYPSHWTTLSTAFRLAKQIRWLSIIYNCTTQQLEYDWIEYDAGLDYE
jgi:hypothetical protein